MILRVSVENYRGLKRADWTVEPGVSLLVGPNGSGKTTLLDVLGLLRDAIERGTKSAVDEHGGPGTLVNLQAAGAEYAQIDLSLGDLAWGLRLRPRAGALGIEHAITFQDKKFVSELPAGIVYGPVYTIGQRVHTFEPPHTVALEPANSSKDSPEMKLVSEQVPDIAPRLEPLLSYRLHGGYLIRSLRVNGSMTSSDTELHRDGTNAFSVLRNWRDARATRPRWDFVVNGLKAAFPDLFEELEFQTAGQTVVASIFAPRMKKSIGAYFAPDGLLTGILHLTAVASAPPGGALAIDEFENSLHPFAVRALLEHIRAWVNAQGISVTLATHSPVLIDRFKEEPSRLLVMDPKSERMPIPIDQLRDPEWLAHFSLGDLYASGEFGSQAAS